MQVWEFENVEHRDTIKSPPFLREFTSLISSSYVDASSADRTGSKLRSLSQREAGERLPRNDDECVWDFIANECMNQGVCVYDYRFGDASLSETSEPASSSSFV